MLILIIIGTVIAIIMLLHLNTIYCNKSDLPLEYRNGELVGKKVKYITSLDDKYCLVKITESNDFLITRFSKKLFLCYYYDYVKVVRFHNGEYYVEEI